MRFNTWCSLLMVSVIACAGCGSSGGDGGGGGGGGSGGSTSTGTGTTSGGGSSSATLQEAAEALCSAACACVTCSDADLAGCVAEYSKDQGATPACLQLIIDQADCATDKLGSCGTTLEAAVKECTPSDAAIAAAGC